MAQQENPSGQSTPPRRNDGGSGTSGERASRQSASSSKDTSDNVGTQTGQSARSDRSSSASNGARSGQTSTTSSTNKSADAARAATESIGDAAERAKDTAGESTRRGTHRLGAQICEIAQALRVSGEELEDQDRATLGGYFLSAAERIDEFGQRIEQKDLSEMLSELRSLARRQPTIFFGASFVAGFALSRFLKSGSARHHTGSQHELMDRSDMHSPREFRSSSQYDMQERGGI